MTDHNSDQGRELRRARLTKIRPLNAEDMLPKAVFNQEYRDFQVVSRERMPDIEESKRVMFCPACHEDEDDELVRARKLHVTYAEDPLRNFRALVTLSCKGCGWNEIVPVAAPEPLTDAENKDLRDNEQYVSRDKMEQMRAQMGVFNSRLGQAAGMQNGALDTARWSAEMQRQYMKQSQLAAMYGAGPQRMKALMSGQIGMIGGIRIVENSALAPKGGQELADHIWGEYELMDRQREEARKARVSNESYRVRDAMMKEMAEQMAKKIDEDVMSELRKVPAPPIKGHGKGRITAPPPPALNAPTPKEMREMVMAAPAEVRPTLMEKLRKYFE